MLNGVRKILIYLIKYANLPVLADKAWQRRSMPTGHKGNWSKNENEEYFMYPEMSLKL